jgi:multidrug efflux pump subunit AcrA (membrane-fusion protein)
MSIFGKQTVAQAKAAVDRLDARLAQARAVLIRAEKAHGEAVADAEMSGKGADAKVTRTRAALARAQADVADAEAALDAARQRLAAAEEQAEAERVAKAWERVAALCAKRNTLARQVEASECAMRAAFAELAAVDGELISVIPVPMERHGINTGPSGIGSTALGGALQAYLARAWRQYRLGLGGRQAVPSSGIADGYFSSFVADRSAAILAIKDRIGTDRATDR